GNYITRIKGRLTKENYNVDKKNIILPDMLSATDANRSDFDIPDKVEYVKYNDYDFKKDEYFSPGLSQYPSYRGMIEYHFPRNENRLTWSKDPDTGAWRWMTNNDYVADVNDGINKGGENTTKSIQYSGKTYEVNGYKVKASNLQPVNNSKYLYNYITGKYRYPVQEANFEDSSTWTKHPPFETGELANPYKIVGKFIPFYTYGFMVHLQGIGEKQNDNILEIQYEGETAQIEPPQPPQPPQNNTPPVAEIFAPTVVVYGQNTYITGSGYDAEDSEDKLTFTWNISPTSYISNETGNPKRLDLQFAQITEYTITLTVTDTGGLSDTAEAKIKVVPPYPAAILNKSGTFKENRKVVVDASNSYSGSPFASINWAKTKWELIPVSQGLTVDDIKTPDSLNGSQKLNLLFKKAGQYKIRCTIYNSWDSSSTAEIDIDIQPDLPPVADFNIISKVTRDPNDDNYATIEITDNSYSSDDYIAKRIWLYAFDSNNDGNFDNEKWYVYDNGIWRLIANSYQELKKINIDNINDGNLKKVKIRSNHVGKYLVELIVREEFGQETIPELINSADKKRDETFDH
ncbi:MAG: PKD domain-containing protein, partial [Caloramator sp.]|nr:PKD domain-containing protein [Caloramator sp.]